MRIILTLILLNWIPPTHEAFWKRHTIDNSSRGADGVRLADVNHDGLMDIAVGWEEGGLVRVYINPGYEQSKMQWKFVTVGQVNSPEDAVLVDLDHDGNVDVVSSCEGNTRSLYVHWAPKNPMDYLDETKWKTEAIPAAFDQQKWMYCLPMQLDGQNGIDLIVGLKGENGSISWLESPANPREVSQWKLHRIYDAGWIMSIRSYDMNLDGHEDIVISDRKGANRGCKWLQNPGDYHAQKNHWESYGIGGADVENMFLDIADLNADHLPDVVSAVFAKQIIWMKSTSIFTVPHWDIHPIDIPEEAGIGKAVRIVDINLDGQMDIVFTSEKADHFGVMWLSYNQYPTKRKWISHPISDKEGYKFDRIEMIDLDGDGDLDLLTCEERHNLGVIWYENPFGNPK